MKITPIEIKEHKFKKAFRGFDQHEVKALTDIVAETLEEAARHS